MAPRKKVATQISAEALRLDVPASTQAPDVVVAEVEVAADPLAGAVNTHSERAESEHKDIGNWQAIHWRGRPMWRHKRTGETQYNRKEVWRNRNAK